MRWPRLTRCWRTFVAISCTLITFCLFYSYHTIDTLTDLKETTLSATSPTSSKTKDEDYYSCYPTSAELANFPNCPSKWAWMKEGWKTDKCYENMGVNGTGCSFREFLSTKERYCPPITGQDPLEGKRAQPNFSKDELFAKMVDKPVNFEFIKKRISRMWNSWKEAFRENEKKHPKTMNNRVKLRIILHLGFLTNTKFGELSSKGGPLGELVQWSDLISSLHILGHDVRISTETNTVLKTLDEFARVPPCPSDQQLDIVFTDIMGLRAMIRKRKKIMDKIKCKLRLLDSFGTHAQFNSKQYFAEHKGELGKKNPWGGHELALRQFLSLYPHTHDNTFLGFVVNINREANGTTVKNAAPRSGVLVYGKEKYMWEKAETAVRTMMEVTEVHATVADAADASALPKGVINHGLLGEEEFHRLLGKVRVFLGLGFPFEGPAPLEAVAHGAVFINPRFDPPKGRLTDRFFAEKPTLRALTSQCPYLEEMGEPWVLTVDTNDTVALKEAVERAMRGEATPRLPHELTAEGMLLRVAVLADRLDTCVARPPWPPERALKEKMSKAGASCEATCAEAGLRCDSALFPAVNKKERMMRKKEEGGEGCERVEIQGKITAPERCTLQENPLWFSCSASVPEAVRLCPCRDYMEDQRELCTECL